MYKKIEVYINIHQRCWQSVPLADLSMHRNVLVTFRRLFFHPKHFLEQIIRLQCRNIIITIVVLMFTLCHFLLENITAITLKSR